MPDPTDVMVGALVSMDPERLAALLGDPAGRGAPWVRAAAQYGLVEGQVRYGRLLLEGREVVRDEAQAFAWFSRAAETGDPEAENMLGRCLENGRGRRVAGGGLVSARRQTGRRLGAV